MTDEENSTDFKKYPSLTGIYKQKEVNLVKELGYDKGTYILTEKIHGANFGIHYKEGQITFSRRKAYLKEDDIFCSHHMIAKDLKQAMVTLMEQSFFTNNEVTVHGEIYGGMFYGEQSQGHTQVQAGVNYSPEVGFSAFDIKVDGRFIAPIDSFPMLEGAGFLTVPVIGIMNGLINAFEFPCKFESRVPQELGLIPKEGNFAEGVVIRPFEHERFLPNGTRVMFKNRTELFSERDTTRKAKVKSDLPEDVQLVLQELGTYLTRPRLNNVLSKELEITQKDFGKVNKLLMEDALVDYVGTLEIDLGTLKENYKVYWKEINKALSKESSSLVREHWVETF